MVAGLAENVRRKLESTYCVCESGTAGPGLGRGPAPGYVALAVARGEGGTVTREVETGLGGEREGNMVAFAEEALRLLRDVLMGEGGGEGVGVEEGRLGIGKEG